MAPGEKIRSAHKLLHEAKQELSQALQNERGRQRGAILQELHNLTRMMGEVSVLYSQAGQDRVVDQLMGQKRGGVFADIGGYDGVTGSNSLFFEIFRGWSGILVEAAPTQLRKAQEVRRCPCLGYAVAGHEGEMEFMEITRGFTQMSGFLDSYDADLLARVRGDKRHEEVIHKLQTRTLGGILRDAGLQKIDFLSLDVEGGEMDILENFAFDEFDIDVWSIENNTGSPALAELMKDKGYDLVEFVGVDDMFRKSANATGMQV